MISRYSREEMARIWDLENRFLHMKNVEIAVAVVQAEMKIIPKKAAQEIFKKAKVNVKRIQEIEKHTKHDVLAFTQNLSESVGEYGKYIHFGLTSSDVLDTAFCLQVQEAGRLVQFNLKKFRQELNSLVKKHSQTICLGRTHGIAAEITTFGYKLSGYLAEVDRCEKKLNQSLQQMSICKLSGAVGTYSSQNPDFELKVAKKLKLQVETIATQVIPRDRYADVLYAIACLRNLIDRLGTELRHLQRTEVSEVIEGFSPGQKGSSAMPHKKNPISSENLCGLARVLRSYVLPAMENTILWHERDISHSSVERIIFPDAFILVDYMIDRMADVLHKIFVDQNRMKLNIERTQGLIFSSHVLLFLVEKGMKREEAYAHVQRISHHLKQDQNLMTQVLNDPVLGQYVKKKELEKIFSGERHLRNIQTVMKRVVQ